ncbi:MAG: hypothetical protein CBE11_03440 [Rickettsiales bacterium TMED251]|nr:MAG: hypothetical protein CBE11_03440 [Rickettsiales bacterium TMED251]
MEEIEIISPETLNENIEKLSIDELIEYKEKLKKFIIEIDFEIKNRKNKKEEANKLFNNKVIK